MRQNYPPEGFSDRLKETILKSGMGVYDIARLSNIKPQNIYHHMNGVATPSLTSFVHLCAVLNVSADYLLFGRSK